MLLLALDTSTRQASIALCAEDELYGEHTWLVGNNHSVELLTCIQRLFAESGLSLRDIDALAVATGPGSFNGLRVATATAKALAFSLQKPLVGVPTLDIIAARQRQWHGPVCAVLEAGRSEVYAACYIFDETHSEDGTLSYRMRRFGDYRLYALQELSTYLREEVGAGIAIPGQRELPPFLFCGEISAASREGLRALMPEEAFFCDRLLAARQASALSWLAFQRLQRGEVDDPLRLEPLYLRRPSITTSARKQPLLNNNTSQRSSADQHQTEREEGALRH